MTDYYAVLGVPRTATGPEIREAYLKLARDTHPDRVKDPEARRKAEDAFKNVTAADDTLAKDRSRRDYSAKLPNNESWTPPAQKAGQIAPEDPQHQYADDDDRHENDDENLELAAVITEAERGAAEPHIAAAALLLVELRNLVAEHLVQVQSPALGDRHFGAAPMLDA